ncbi:HlyD family secretion protein [Dyadobacter sp. 50-39]|uniref:HlyD family secretion protein n=1 Tax=Dyadobacter sp. 50-39 TaxID=1895756 RepID=UPI0025C3D28A|nr:HlyD family efflux transporter periplasmic adaptor subunit [Dyadobacter sp. 50-39]
MKRLSSTVEIFQEIQSVDVEEIMGRKPHWVLTSGISLLAIVFGTILACTNFIKYPDIVSAPFILNGDIRPYALKAKIDGRLTRLMVEDGQPVKKGAIVGMIESNADYETILRLENELKRISEDIGKHIWSTPRSFALNQSTTLGELQEDYQIFDKEFTKINALVAEDFYKIRKDLLSKDVTNLENFENLLKEQHASQTKEFVIAEEEFLMQERLFKENVISKLDFKREQAKFIAKSTPQRTTETQIIQNQSTRLAKNRELVELEYALYESKYAYKQSVEALANSIKSWKQKYLLYSPVDGIISFRVPVQQLDYVVNGQEILLVQPLNHLQTGLIRLAQKNLGKIRKGQTVLIKMDGYPYREYGMLVGKLSRIAAVPGRDSLYWGYVSLPVNLTTQFGHQITFKQGLTGQGEVVTQDRSLANRLISGFRSDFR